jgi:hypothetical protein
MTLKSIHTAIRASIVGAVLVTCLIALGASAQFSGPSVFAGKFTLPYEVHWGRSVLSPGAYSISIEAVQEAAIVRSANGQTNMFVRVPILGDTEKGAGTCLTIVHRGNERRVQALNLPELGKMLIYEPLTKAEHEELAKAGQVQTLSLTTAKK